MALISPRTAHNFAKNGYYPTDNKTMSAVISHITSPYVSNILDPCIGEAEAAQNLAYSLSMSKLYGIEYNKERSEIANKRCDFFLNSDLFDTVISPQSFGLLFLNPPYGDLIQNHGMIKNYQSGLKRLEQIFYKFCVPKLQYDGILVFIIPITQIDPILTNWISSQFTDVLVYTAVDKQFRQIVIMGRKVRQNDIERKSRDSTKKMLLNISTGEFVPGEITVQSSPVYTLPASVEVRDFYKLSLSKSELENEIKKNPGLWNQFDLLLNRTSISRRQPLCKMSEWHLSLALAAGEISGIVTSETGKTYVIKGDTYKTQVKKVEISGQETNEPETRVTMTDKFIPSIKAWDFTESSKTFGHLFDITSITNNDDENNIMAL